MGRLTISLFLCKIVEIVLNQMNKERIKLIVRNMELLIDALKQELNEDAPIQEEVSTVPFEDDDYDEVFSE